MKLIIRKIIELSAYLIIVVLFCTLALIQSLIIWMRIIKPKPKKETEEESIWYSQQISQSEEIQIR